MSAPPSSATLNQRLYLPAHLVDALIGHLLGADLIREVNDEQGAGFVPARPLEQLSVANIVGALRHNVGIDHWATSGDQGDAIDKLLLLCERDASAKMGKMRWTDLMDETQKKPLCAAPQ